MGKVIKVTPEELLKAGTALQEHAEAYTTIYTKLMEQAGTMGTAWQGDDNVAFVNQINGFCDDLKAMADKLSAGAASLQKQAENYQQRQESNIAAVKKLAN